MRTCAPLAMHLLVAVSAMARLYRSQRRSSALMPALPRMRRGSVGAVDEFSKALQSAAHMVGEEANILLGGPFERFVFLQAALKQYLASTGHKAQQHGEDLQHSIAPALHQLNEVLVKADPGCQWKMRRLVRPSGESMWQMHDVSHA